ncbi:unnamed protein product [Paramecium octaurelia]|uniref:Transmembrane protein n=1 Tax=Paramecium octaurelia TaxID=43137 RepID=A0A8S1WGU5_PAROT|nr:unnamed protein product [Paramecium octaurelia]
MFMLIFFSLVIDSNQTSLKSKDDMLSAIRGNYKNVLQKEEGAIISSKSQNGMKAGNNGSCLNDQMYDLEIYTWNSSGYSITFQLRQIYELNTLKIWFWDGNSRIYRFKMRNKRSWFMTAQEKVFLSQNFLINLFKDLEYIMWMGIQIIIKCISQGLKPSTIQKQIIIYEIVQYLLQVFTMITYYQQDFIQIQKKESVSFDYRREQIILQNETFKIMPLQDYQIMNVSVQFFNSITQLINDKITFYIKLQIKPNLLKNGSVILQSQFLQTILITEFILHKQYLIYVCVLVKCDFQLIFHYHPLFANNFSYIKNSLQQILN